MMGHNNFSSLNKVASDANVIDKQLCKYEQISNWDRRPLRKSQLHYAALDAYVLLKILDKWKPQAKKGTISSISDYVETIDLHYYD